MLTPLLLCACVGDLATPTSDNLPPIMLDVRKTTMANSLACEVEVFATYPSDMQPQIRELVIFDTSSEFVRSLATVEVPRPGEDSRPVANENGTTSFRMFQWSFSRCREVPLKIKIGACKQGPCPDMRVSTGIPDGVTVDVVRMSPQS